MSWPDIYEDKSTWLVYGDKDSLEGQILVYARCQHCGRFLKHGKVLENAIGEIITKDWTCKVHGEVQVHWERQY